MPVQPLVDSALALVVLAFLASRQLGWRRFDPAKAFRLPALLVVGGLVVLAEAGGVLTVADLALLLLELLVSLGVGLGMGSLLQFRTGPGGGMQTRTGWLGAALWAAVLGTRLGIDVFAHQLGAPLLTSPGVILLMIGLTRTVLALVARSRAPRPAPALGMIDA